MGEKIGEVRPITEEELQHFTIKDIVMPVIGHNSKLPENKVALLYKEVLESIGLDIGSFSIKTGT